jgi:GNAT superfamily N-acetyltransferase
MIGFRDATAADAPLVAHMHMTSWRSAYAAFFDPAYLAGPIEADRLQNWTSTLSKLSMDQRAIIAEDDGAAIGFTYVIRGKDPRWGSFVDNLHVLPDLKGKGIGPRLLAEAARWSIEGYPQAGLYLFCYEANMPARAFYERAGGIAAEHLTDMVASDGKARPEIRYHWPTPESLIR